MSAVKDFLEKNALEDEDYRDMAKKTAHWDVMSN